jgi:VWFA-related protein
MSRIIAAVRQPALALAGLTLALGAPAQEKADRAKSQFFETVQVNLISVEVFVTDRAGKQVTGLRREDFEVFEDGRPVTITNFFAAEPSAPAPAFVTGSEQATQPKPGDQELLPVEQRLSVVVLVDNSGITGAERSMALRHGRDMLANCLKLPRSQAMVVTLDLRAHVRQTFTTDPVLLAAALKKAEGEPPNLATGAMNAALIERAMSRISVPSQLSDVATTNQSRRAENRDFDLEDARSILQTIRSAAEADHENTRAMLISLTNFISSLAGLPGRKVVFYVGNGLNLRPGESLFMKWASRFGASGADPTFSPAQEANRLSLSGQFRDLVARANADRVMFYAIDASGGALLGGPTAEQALLDPEPGANLTEAMGRQTSLQYMAYATGGATIVSTPKASAVLARTLQDFDTYYSLAYAAPRIGDGMSHAIKVKVHREGVVVRHRQNYLDKTADERVVERNLSALLHESGSNSMGIEVVIGTPVAQKDRTFAVPLMIAVPVGKLVLLTEGDTHRGAISIFLAAKDLDDRITPPIKRKFALSVPNDKLTTALGQVANYTFMVVMTRGPQTVAVSVRDDLAQAESTVTARFTVGERPTGALSPKQLM